MENEQFDIIDSIDKCLDAKHETFDVCLNGEPIKSFKTEKEAKTWADVTYGFEDERVTIEEVPDEIEECTNCTNENWDGYLRIAKNDPIFGDEFKGTLVQADTTKVYPKQPELKCIASLNPRIAFLNAIGQLAFDQNFYIQK